MEKIRSKVSRRFSQDDFARKLVIEVKSTDSRFHSIIDSVRKHDLIIMSIQGKGRLSRAFFGSLAEDVAQRVDETMLLVRAGSEESVFAAWTEPI